MAQHTRQQRLRVDVPTLEPDAVMIERLAALSAGSTPSKGKSRSIGLRAAFVATVVASLGATTWAAGALPGVGTPFRHERIEHAPLVPIATPRVAGSPQSSASSSGGPVLTGLPDHSSAHANKGKRNGQGKGKGRKHGQGPGHGRHLVAPGAGGDHQPAHGSHGRGLGAIAPSTHAAPRSHGRHLGRGHSHPANNSAFGPRGHFSHGAPPSHHAKKPRHHGRHRGHSGR